MLTSNEVADVQRGAPEADALFFGERYRENPYEVYSVFREFDPVHWNRRMNMWMLFRYDDVVSVAKDERASSDTVLDMMGQLDESVRGEMQPLHEILENRMLFKDAPEHTRIRTLMNKAFAPRLIEGMKARIQEHVDTSVRKLESRSTVDLVSDFADAFPCEVMMRIFGLEGDPKLIKKWTDDIYLFMGLSSRPPLERAKVALPSVMATVEYLRIEIAKKRANLREDLLSSMISAEDELGILSEKELYANVVSLLNASNETTTNLITSCILCLLQNPKQFEMVRDDPTKVDAAIEETLRFHSPIQTVAPRKLKGNMEVGGKSLLQGDRVALMLGSANRDTRKFDKPEQFDITRVTKSHIGMGYGPHFCVGGALGRMMARSAVGTILRRFPNMRLPAQRLEWRANASFRGVQSLVLNW